MKKIINFKDLIVNPKNFRFDPVENPEKAIDLMIEKKGKEILSLAKHILENGLDEAKDLRVLEVKKNKYLVLDGNRRMTAVKCLNNPKTIKDKKIQDGFFKLLNGGIEPISDVKCFVYPDEEAAAQWIQLDHTGKNDGIGQDPWGSAEKERFEQKFGGKISLAMQAVNILEKEMGIKINTKKLKLSTINRILSNPQSREYLGVENNRGNLVFACDQKESVERFDKLFHKVISDNVTVAEVYQTQQAIEFVKELFKDKPKSCKKVALPFPDEEDQNNTVMNTSKAISRTLAKGDWITYKEYTEYRGAERVKLLLKEMQKIELRGNENILMSSLRVLLELSLYHRLEEKKYIVKMVASYKAKIKAENIKRASKGAAIIEPKKNWTPSFREMLSYIVDERNDVIDDPQARVTLEKMIKKEENFVADLNDFIHNVHCIPSKDDLEKTWNQFGRLIFVVIGKIK